MVKRMRRTANDVSFVRLEPDPKRVTLIIVASDGLWDAVDKLPLKSSSFASFLTDRLNAYGDSDGVNQRLSEDITRWAGSTEKDDVTVGVSSLLLLSCFYCVLFYIRYLDIHAWQ